LYPNPATESFTIDTKLIFDGIELYDYTGNKVLDISYSKDRLDVSTLEPGVYSVVLKYKKNIVGPSQQLIVVR
jgi:hypothetical protein